MTAPLLCLMYDVSILIVYECTGLYDDIYTAPAAISGRR